MKARRIVGIGIAGLALVAALSCSACSSTHTDRVDAPPLTTVESVDLTRYTGLWYEIARLPNSFQADDCAGTTATYRLEEDGEIDVYNRCYLGGKDGEIDDASGSAYVVEGSNNTKLRVTFFWPFYGDYWIVALDKDYQWVVVSEPGRDYAWILARSPQMDAALYERIVDQMSEMQIPVDKLIRGEQFEQAPPEG